jgi:membrane protein
MPFLVRPLAVGRLLKETLHIFSARGARFLGAAVAFYALMSAAPLFVLVLGIVGLAFGHQRAEDALWGGLAHWVAPEGIATARGITDRLYDAEREGGIVDVALVVYGSTRLFRALRRAVNQLWGIDLEEIDGARGRTRRYAVRYVQAFGLTLFVAVMLASLLAVKSAYAFLASFSAREPPLLLSAMDLVTSVALTFALFFLLFRVLPATRVSWREAALGAGVSTGLFALGSGVVTAYVRHKHTSDLYGGASAVVLAVFWVYYSVQVFFLGACFSAALRERVTEPGGSRGLR